jgi:2-dehydropantoate 2-reductase
MRILVVGAGALGSYFGACLVHAGRDVTFLVRPKRAEQIARDGLRVTGKCGDFAIPAKIVAAAELNETFDLILLAIKAYSFDEAVEQFAAGVGPNTAIIPILNGMRHIDRLVARFGVARVFGGMAQISATLDANGRVALLFPIAELVFGELTGGLSERIKTLSGVLGDAGFTARVSDIIVQDMWEKWLIVGTTAGITCLMRASIGDIIAAPGGQRAILRLFEENCAVGTAAGFPPRQRFIDEETPYLTQVGSPLKASMLRDIERGGPTEGDHILGDLLLRARGLAVPTPVLELAHCHVSAYEVSHVQKRGNSAPPL